MKFSIYKKGQGKYTRLGSAMAWMAIAVFGCITLFNKMTAIDIEAMSQSNEKILDTLVPVGVFLLIGWFVYWIVNKQSIADFMIDAEGEMKKVSWSSKQEIIVSTTIVIVVVIIMASFLGLVDLMFQMFFGSLFGK